MSLLSLPKHIQDAINHGALLREERVRKEEDERAKRAEAEKAAALRREQLNREEAERWFHNVLPKLIEQAMVDGHRFVEIDRVRPSYRGAVCEAHGMKVEYTQQQECEYDTGHPIGWSDHCLVHW